MSKTNNRGRPKGSTASQKSQDKVSERQCLDSIIAKYGSKVADCKQLGKRVEKGFLSELIVAEKNKFNVKEEVSICTVRSRHRNGHATSAGKGATSPLADAETALVQICIQMGKIRQPLNCTEAIQLMNNLIEGTDTQKALIEFKSRRKIGGNNLGRVTKNWWRGFLRRHEHEIVTKRGEKFALNRHDWTTYDNIKQMYDVIYDEMLDAKVAILLDEPIYTDIRGNVVEETERFGLLQHMTITKPSFIVFADESGFSTSQKKDGHVGGQKLVVESGTVPQIMASTTDHKFTLLPFTSASGEAVCCAIIFQSKQDGVPATWTTGIDHSVQPMLSADENEIELEGNFGEGKYYPGGPKCKFNGKVVDCLTFSSESGGISGDILVDILKYFDQIDLFPRVDGGPIPVLIVDGHQSRLDPKFVDYINDSGHKWKVCLGVPYATTLWQVGDASEQNGFVKTEWYREKAKLLLWKNEHDLPRAIRPEDVMPIMNKIFSKAYGNEKNNRKATADRGWYPPNRKLLEHPSFVAQPEHNQNYSSMPTLPALNVEEGIAGSVLDRLLRERSRSEGAKKAAEKRKQTGDAIVENIKKSQRLTSGVLAQNSIHSLDDPRFLEPFRQRRLENAQKEEQKKSNLKAKASKLVHGVKAMRDKWGHESAHKFVDCDSKECGAYLQYKKMKNDPAMPKGLVERRQRCVDWMGRPSPTSSPCQSDDENEGCNNSGPSHSNDAVQALLGMAATHTQPLNLGMDCVDGLMQFATQAGGGGGGTMETCGI
jgi:hypothetical protein